MIHDIDILLSLVKSDVYSLDATGMSIITNSLDIAQARIKFNNGTVASSCPVNIKVMLKNKLFKKFVYYVDLLKVIEIYKMKKKKSSSDFEIREFNAMGKKFYNV